MADIRGLGQAGGARGENVERLVVTDRAGVRHGIAALLGQGRIKIMRAIGCSARFAGHPDGRRAFESGAGFGVRCGQLAAQHQMAGLCDGDAMSQRGPAQIGVDHRDNGARLQKTQPRHDEFGTVFHQKCDDVALFHAL